MDAQRRNSANRRLSPQQLALASVGVLGAMALGVEVRRRHRYDFADKVALVTGGSRGLGLLLAAELLGRGADVTICARDAAELQTARDWLKKRTGATASTVVCDVANQQDVNGMVASIVARRQRLDVIVNNAGVIQVAPVEATKPADFEQAMAIMYWGIYYMVQAALPELKRSKGRIINITSIGGRFSVPHLLPYSSAKFAATGYSLGLRAELAKDGVCVTTIAPGLMRTGSYDQALFKGQSPNDYYWFALGSTLPLITINAERAARQIIAAARRGDAFRHIGLPAMIAGTIGGAFPGLTARVLSLVNRALPTAKHSADKDTVKGASINLTIDSLAFKQATALGRQAQQDYQHGLRHAD